VKTLKVVFLIDPHDNVVTATSNIKEGTTITIEELSKKIRVKQAIPIGHKIAIKKIKKGEPIIKYGAPIGRAKKDIDEGEWIHTHNVEEVYKPP